jgi:carboxyl-terminal processing protease
MERRGMRIRQILVAGALIALPFAAGAFLRQGPRRAPDGARLFAQVLQRIEDNAVDSLSRNAIYEKAARGLVKNLKDPYADLYSPEELASFTRNSLRNKYGGLGMQIEPQEDQIVVTRVFPNTPAERGGVMTGDHIISVDSVVVIGLKLEQVSNRLVGEPGTQVDVVFQRQGVAQPIKGRFTRAVIRPPAVPFTMMLDGGVGYIPLQSFNESASEDVAKALVDLRSRGAHSYVFDLRGNGGGSLDEALEISKFFLKPGQEVASVRHRGLEPKLYEDDRPAPLVDSMPVVVMVDGSTASASEIVAGSLQDHDRAVVVGTTSFGKGLVQTLYTLDGGWALKLTTGKWYTPSGRSIQAEHDRLEDDRFVEYAKDSVPSDTTHKRPVFKSDAGRQILGGGGVTPDVVVQPDTISDREREFFKALAPYSGPWRVTLYNYALEMRSHLTPDFTVTPEMRHEFVDRLVKAKVPVRQAQFDSLPGLIDRAIEEQFTRIAFGDSTYFRRSIRTDPQIRTALDLLHRGTTQRKLLALAAAEGKKTQ